VHVVAVDDFPVDPDSWAWEADAHQQIATQEETVRRLLDGQWVTWSRRVGRPRR
jgi:hypothetical protein